MRKKSNIEILRVISMLMIVFHHYSIHSNWAFPADLSSREYFIRIIGSFGKIGVILFVMISGYFMKRSNFKVKKALRLWLQVFFYSAGFYFLFTKFGNIDTSGEMWHYLFPIISNVYWFATTYLFVYFMMPLLKKILSFYPPLKIVVFLSFFIVMMRLLTILGYTELIPGGITLNQAVCFLIYLTLGYLIKEFEAESEKKSLRKMSIVAAITGGIILAGPVIIVGANARFNWNIDFYFFSGLNSIVAILFSVAIFILILNIKLENKYINIVGSTTFGIYLIHDHPFVREYIWESVFKNKEHFYDNSLIIRTIFEPLLVFLVCMVIELLRQKLFSFCSTKVYVSGNNFRNDLK